METFKKDIIIKDSVLEELDVLNNLDKNSQEYKDIYNKVIQVGEYDI